jgi:hypothetical protein
VDCRSTKTKSREGNAHLCRGGSCDQERVSEELQKHISPREDLRRTARHWPFSTSLLISRVFLKETQARSQFGTLTRNIPELGIWGNRVGENSINGNLRTLRCGDFALSADDTALCR